MIKVKAIKDIKIANVTIPKGARGLVSSVITGEPGVWRNAAFVLWEAGTFLMFEDEVEEIEND